MEGPFNNMKSFISKVKPRQLRTFFFVLGLILFAYLIFKLNPAKLWAELSKIGPNIFWILIPTGTSYFAYAWAWEIFLRGTGATVSYWNIFKIKVSGEAINSITPLSWGGGDPARVYFLKEHVPVNAGTASVVVDRTLNNLAVALFMMIGVTMAFIKFKLPMELKIGLLITVFVIIGSSVFFYIRSHEGLFEFFLDVLKKLHLKRHFSENTMARVHEIDRHISEFYRDNKPGFFKAFGLHFYSRLQSPIEIYLIGIFMGFPLTFVDCYLLSSLTILVNLIFVFVPGAFGVMEGAYAGTFSLFHLNPIIGASIQIIRRIRMLLWTALGFLFMYRLRDPETRVVQKPISG
jgi:glycosyltransferase 2 family protein